MVQRKLPLSDNLELELAEVLKTHRRGLSWRQQAKSIIKGAEKRGIVIRKEEHASSG